MFIKQTIDNSGSIYLFLNADDIQMEMISNFALKRQCLGIDIQRYADKSISLGQLADFNIILKRFQMQDEQPVSTALNPHLRLDGIAETTLAPRPDIEFAVAVLGRYDANLRTGRITTARRLLRHLKTATDYRLYYSKSINGRLIGFTDSDWAGDIADRKSQGGYIFGLNGSGSISWQLRKQDLVATSTHEARILRSIKRSQMAITATKGHQW